MMFSTISTLSILLFHPNFLIFFFFNDTATTEIDTLSLHDALPISSVRARLAMSSYEVQVPGSSTLSASAMRSEEHTSELQSRQYLVCRLLLEKKKKKRRMINILVRYK